MKIRWLVLTSITILAICFMLLIPLASAADLSASTADLSASTATTSASVSDGVATFTAAGITIDAKTNINGEQFVGTEKTTTSRDVTYKSGEKILFVISDPVVQQTYEYLDSGSLKETIVLKEPRDISYTVGIPAGSYLQEIEGGEYKVFNPKANEATDGYIVIQKPTAVDNTGNSITLAYEFDGKDTLSVVFPEYTDMGKEIQYPVTVDPVIDHRYQLVLLLHGNLEPSAFSTTDIRDSSRYFDSGYVTGIASINSTYSKFGNASYFYKGAYSNVTLNDAPQFTLGLNNWSINAWVYYPTTAAATGAALYQHYDNASNYDTFTMSLNQLYFSAIRSGSTVDFLSVNPVISTGAWHNIGLIQNGTTVTAYLDGAQVGSTGTRTASLTALSSPIRTGDVGGTGVMHIDELTVFNGGFAPTIDQFYPGAEYPLYLNASVNGPNMGYADDNKTVSLLHFDGANAGTVFYDSVGNRTWVASSATTGTSVPKFGVSSGYFNGTGRVQASSGNTNFDFGTGDFTIDCWVNVTNFPAGVVYYTGFFSPFATGTNGGYLLGMNSGNQLALWTNTSGPVNIAAGGTVPNNVWTHVAAVRSGNTVKLYMNGVSTASADATGYQFNSYGHLPLIGGTFTDAPSTWTYQGSIDELRVTKGYARWTSSFTPPTTPYELITNVTSSATPAGAGNVPAAIQFNLVDPSGAWTNNAYLWTFGDGSTSTLQNPSHTYSSQGIYSVVANVYNNNMTVSTTPLTVQIGAPFVDFTGSPTTGTAALRVTFTDLTTNTTPTSYLIDFGDGTTSTATPPWTHVYSTYGAFSVNLTETNSVGTGYNYKRDYIITSTSQEQQTTFYSPVIVRYTIQDFYLSPLDNLNVTATPLNFTAPANWTNLLIGIKPSVNILGTSVQGWTGTDGTIAFPMLYGIQYQISIAGTTADGRVVGPYIFTTYPDQNDYLLTIPTSTNPGLIPTTPPTNVITYSAYNTSYNSTTNFYNMTYRDPTGGTTAITFYIADSHGNVTYSQTITGAGANAATFTNLTKNPNGGSVTCGFYANQSVIGVINQQHINQFINHASFSGGSPGWVEEWLALGLIVLVAAFFSYASVPMGAIIVIGLTAYFTWGIGWIQPYYGYSAMSTGLITLGFFAAIKYIRRKEDTLS